MKKLSFAIAAMLLAGCSSMGPGNSGSEGYTPGMSNSGNDTNPTPYVFRPFDLSNPYHGG